MLLVRYVLLVATYAIVDGKKYFCWIKHKIIVDIKICTVDETNNHC